jgi:hypothetical protein
MNKIVLSSTAAIIALVAMQAGFADDLTVPNTFTANTPARAAEVNENFTAVEASVDDNAADIAANATDIATNAADVVVTNTNVQANTSAVQSNTSAIAAISISGGAIVYSQGTAIGQFLTIAGNADAPLAVLSDKGFIYSINALEHPNGYLGIKQPVYFAETNCTGAAYVQDTNAGRWAAALGSVFRPDPGAPATAYYTQRGGLLMSVTFASLANNDQCYVDDGGTGLLFAAFPNDEAVTGVSDTAPALPLTIGLP